MYHLNMRTGELPRSASSHFLTVLVLVLYFTALYCIVSYGILCYLIVSNSIAQYCTLLRCWLRRAGCVSQDANILHVISVCCASGNVLKLFYVSFNIRVKCELAAGWLGCGSKPPVIADPRYCFLVSLISKLDSSSLVLG